jgi:hypothetical protein
MAVACRRRAAVCAGATGAVGARRTGRVSDPGGGRRTMLSARTVDTDWLAAADRPPPLIA